MSSMYAQRSTSGAGAVGVGMLSDIVAGAFRLLAEDRVVDLAEVDVHGLLIRVEVDRPVSALVTESRGLDTAEGGAQIADVVRVQPHHSGLDGLREVVRPLEIRGPDVGGETVLRVVRQLQGLLKIGRASCRERGEISVVAGAVARDGRGRAST